jgi:hypothetical protein
LKKTPLLITAAITVTLFVGYFAYEYLLKKKAVSVWNLVPDNALLVYEKGDCANCVQTVSNSAPFRILAEASLFTKSADSLKSMLQSVTSNKYVLSLHTTRKDEFDLIFYLPVDPASWKNLSEKVKVRNSKLTKRGFDGLEIHEINVGGQVFSWVLIEEIWVGSFTPFLIEDVIRSYHSDQGFVKKISNKNFRVSSGDAGNLYIQFDKISEWLSIFGTENNATAKLFGESVFLDVKTENGNITLNGFNSDSTNRSKYLLSIFKNQSPVAFSLKQYVTDRTVVLYSFGLSNGSLFRSDLNQFLKVNKIKTADSLELIGKSSGIDFNKLYSGIHREISVCLTESSSKKKNSKVLMIETQNPSEWLNAFQTLSNKYSIDTLFYEQFSNYIIKEVPLYRFPEKLFFPLITGFDKSFYTSIDNTIFIADDVDELKNFLDDIDDENTWGKSVTHNSFLETTLLESNVSVYVNASKVWNVLTPGLHPKWRQFARQHQQLLQTIELSAFQCSHLNGNYYTNISLNYSESNKGFESDKKAKEHFAVNFTSNVSGMYSVKSHVNRADEILIQDSINDLSLVSSDGVTLWKTSIGKPITSQVSQIDFFNNGKLQYFFTTSDEIHVIDRLGNYVEPYPIKMPASSVTYGNVVDYDRSKKYRFLISDGEGKLWMFDKAGNNLEGWSSKATGGSLLSAPRHYRIQGKDYVVAIRKDGVVNLYTRRGEIVKNFPLNLQTRLSGDYFLERGNSLATTNLIVVSTDGFKIRISMDGKVQSRETLLKTSVSSRFGLVNEQHGKSYFVYQQDSRQTSLHDAEGSKIFINESIGLDALEISCYDFGSGKLYTSLTDATQGMTYIYDSSGIPVTSAPINATMLDLRLQTNNDIRIFFVRNNSLIIQSLTR